MSSIKFSSFGAYITSWQINGREVLYQGSELKRAGIPLLFPNFDKGDPLPYHGFGRLSQWQVIIDSGHNFHLRLTDNDLTSDFRQVYSYKFTIDLEVATIDNSLHYQLTVQNLDHKPLPLAPGLHPYWPISHSQKLKISIPGISIHDWDNNPPNGYHQFNGQISIIFPEYRLTIQDLSPQRHFHGLQIWSQNQSMPDFNFVCFEPVTRPPDGLNQDPILLKPGQSTRFHICFTCQF